MAANADADSSYARTVSPGASPTSNRPQPNRTYRWSPDRLDLRISYRPATTPIPGIAVPTAGSWSVRGARACGRNTFSDHTDSDPTWRPWTAVAYPETRPRTTSIHPHRWSNLDADRQHIPPAPDRCLLPGWKSPPLWTFRHDCFVECSCCGRSGCPWTCSSLGVWEIKETYIGALSRCQCLTTSLKCVIF